MISKRRFDLKTCLRIKKEYEDVAVSLVELSEKYKVSPVTVKNSILFVGGEIRGLKECHRKFSLKQSAGIRQEYESGLSATKIAKNYNCSDTAIYNALLLAGGKIRPKTEHRRLFFRKPNRERQLSCSYQLKSADVDWLWVRQEGLCLWCLSPLPKDSLDCIVDHVGRKAGLSKREKVRGLCCPDNICNTLAGRVESNPDKRNWGTIEAFVKRAKHIIKTNKGNLPFPRKMK